MTKAPPVPPQNRSPKGTGDKGTGDRKTAATGEKPRHRPGNPDQQGQQANTKQNTTHQGYQQDR